MKSSDANPNDIRPSASLQDILGRSGRSNAETKLPLIELDDGAQIQVWVHPGRGTPLVFLYGLGCGISHWKYQVQHFQEQGFLTIQMDLRGHGESTLGAPERPLSIKTLSSDTAKVLAHLNVNEAIVLGQSMGGTIGLHLAHDYPELIKALILQGSPGRDPFSRMNLGIPVRTVIKMLETLRNRTPNWLHKVTSMSFVAPVLARELVRAKGFSSHLAKTEDIDQYLQDFFASDPEVFSELADDLALFDITKFEHQINCPTLIIAGSQDKIIPVEECRWLSKRLPGSHLEVIPHGSHCPHLEDPHEFNRRIGTFLQTYQP